MKINTQSIQQQNAIRFKSIWYSKYDMWSSDSAKFVLKWPKVGVTQDLSHPCCNSQQFPPWLPLHQVWEHDHMVHPDVKKELLGFASLGIEVHVIVIIKGAPSATFVWPVRSPKTALWLQRDQTTRGLLASFSIEPDHHTQLPVNQVGMETPYLD